MGYDNIPSWVLRGDDMPEEARQKLLRLIPGDRKFLDSTIDTLCTAAFNFARNKKEDGLRKGIHDQTKVSSGDELKRIRNAAEELMLLLTDPKTTAVNTRRLVEAALQKRQRVRHPYLKTTAFVEQIAAFIKCMEEDQRVHGLLTAEGQGRPSGTGKIHEKEFIDVIGRTLRNYLGEIPTADLMKKVARFFLGEISALPGLIDTWHKEEVKRQAEQKKERAKEGWDSP